MRSEHPELLRKDGSLDERKLFEGWCIQKIAGLQVLLEYYEKRLANLSKGAG